jgi:hypothetical protein
MGIKDATSSTSILLSLSHNVDVSPDGPGFKTPQSIPKHLMKIIDSFTFWSLYAWEKGPRDPLGTGRVTVVNFLTKRSTFST